MQASIFLVALALMFVAGWFANVWYHRHHEHKKPRRVSVTGFKFTSPLLDVELPEGVGVNFEPLPFKYKVSAYLKELIANGHVREVAVYYRDLHDGPWFGINEDKEFDPASMMKVVVMIAWLKRAEKDPQVLNRFVTNRYSDDMRLLQAIKPAKWAKPWHSYQVDELLRFMMNYSDNNATRLLYELLKPEEINVVLDSMDVNSKIKNGNNSISVYGYSGFFRILYNASYLNRDMSEKALQLLSLQDFPQGIAAGVPKGTAVASKFGETEKSAGEDKQLHEFGIVYHPKGAYVLGIMTKGKDYDQLAKVISGVSRLIYDEVDSAPGNRENHRK